MALNNQDQARIREYLLGKLSEADQEKIEERLMVEDELFDEFEASKDELVEEYRADELGSAERKFFEEHFLRSVEGQERYKFVLAMNCLQDLQPAVIGEETPAPVLHDKPPPPTVFGRLKTFLSTQPWAVATVSAVVLLAAAVFIVNQMRSRQPGQTFAATLQGYSLNRGEEAKAPTWIKLPPNTAFLKLRLQLSKPAVPGTRYTAVLDDRTNKKSIDIAESDAESVTVVIPADLVPNHQYAVKLSITNPDGSEQDQSYRFVIAS